MKRDTIERTFVVNINISTNQQYQQANAGNHDNSTCALHSKLLTHSTDLLNALHRQLTIKIDESKLQLLKRQI